MRAGLARVLGGSAVFGTLLLAAPAPAQVRDVEMKAAYIYNFVQFTSWPSERERERERETLAVCAERASVLWPALHAYNGRQVGGRAWRLLDSATHPKGAGCDLLVLGRTAEAQAAPGLLVVRDGAGAGAAINLVDDDEQLRFDVDTREAARAGLRLSSKLLRLARNVL
ncbi:hypothetical protein B0920_17430 [Massilia sp. KIM]|uniref:YfiR family protein n=1 Tax=Massilia sp. KIM TaxID=1955422 RepID=UPI00098FEA0A|nr:YfiR family protein [Massilia sp. KIM]OON60741.1 hypothetical protein B0920_17430 [Massilia sp. KIM]